jgi:hypothetical protein
MMKVELKQNLPTKICRVNKPLLWRKKNGKKVWDEVNICSDKCRSNK